MCACTVLPRDPMILPTFPCSMSMSCRTSPCKQSCAMRAPHLSAWNGQSPVRMSNCELPPPPGAPPPPIGAPPYICLASLVCQGQHVCESSTCVRRRRADEVK